MIHLLRLFPLDLPTLATLCYNDFRHFAHNGFMAQDCRSEFILG